MNLLARIKRHPLVLLLGMGPLLGCHSTGGGDPTVRILESAPPDKPAWLDKTPFPSEGLSFFVGNSNFAASETEAKDLAMDAALKNAAVYVGIQLDGELQGVRKMNHDASTVADPAIEQTEHWVGKTSAYFSRFQPEQWFVQHLERNWGRGEKERSFSASVLLSIPTEVVEAAIEEAQQQRRQTRYFPNASLHPSREKGSEGGNVMLVNEGCSEEALEPTTSCCCRTASPRSSHAENRVLEEQLDGRRLRLADGRRRLSLPRVVATSPPSITAPRRSARGQ